MKIALIGATGQVGSQLLAEATRRGHVVTAISRSVAKLPSSPGVTAKALDINDTQALTDALRDHDAVIVSAVSRGANDVRAATVSGIRSLLSAVKAAGVPRLLVVGGAGSLEVAPGVALVDTPAFPAAWKPEAEGARDVLHILRDEPSLDWTMLSPSAMLEPGERTGRFRLGGDQLLADAKGDSHISTADYAVAMIDELDKPAHSRRRFTVGY